MITKLSPAKINLTLDVKPKVAGADFHELETIYHLLNWGDEMTIESSDSFELVGNFDCAMEDNLIYKAWELAQQYTPPNLPQKGRSLKPVKVKVEKRIPTGGGLGGGSSNVVTFVKSYFELFSLGPIPPELITKLGDLGKDISFFFHSEPCGLGRHYGEVIQSLDFNFSGTTLYLYFSGTKSPTPQAYAQLKDFNTHHTQGFLADPRLENCGNTFEQIFEQKNYSNIHISGSGSTWFSFEKLDMPGWEMVETTLL